MNEYTDLPEEVVKLLDSKTGFTTSPELLNAKHRLASIYEDEIKAKEILRKLESTKGKWLNVRPTEPGYYWVNEYRVKRVVLVWRGGTSNRLYVNEIRHDMVLLEDDRYDHTMWWSESLIEPG